MRLLGIDPGSRVTGYGVVEVNAGRLVHVAHGAIVSESGSPLAARLVAIYRGLSEAMEAYGPAEVSIESIFHARNVQSALKLGHARGVALLAAELGGVSVVEYSPMQVKLAVVGYGRADKRQVQDMVRRLLRLPEPAGPDASDALAVAICHAQTRRTADAYAGRRAGAR